MSRIDQHATVHALADGRCGGNREIHADHHALDSQFLDDRQFRLQSLEPPGELIRHRLAVLQQPVLLDRLNSRQARGHRQRVAAEGAGMHPRQQAGRVFVLGDHHAAGDPSGQPLGDGHHVGLDAVVLVAVPTAGPRHPGLHLVEDQQGPHRIGDLTQTLQEARLRQVHTSLALDRLDQDRTGLGSGQLADPVQIVEAGVVEAGHQRTDALVVLRLSRRSGRSKRAAVEAVVETDHAVATRLGPVQPHQLQGSLDRLGTAVAEKCLAESAAAQRLGKIALRLGVPGVGDVDQLRDLLFDRFDHSRRTVAQDVAAPAGEQVQVPSPLGIPHTGSLATDQADRVATVVGDHVLLELGNRVLARALG